MGEEPRTLRRLRGFVLLIVTAATLGMGTDLLLMGHYEDANQIIPLALAGTALPLIGWTAARPRPFVLRALQLVMLCFMGAGVTGMTLHAQANAEFQREIDPGIGMWDLFWKVTEATSPPALAPAVMVQLGLLGLVYTYKHPALLGEELNSSERRA
ncbi:MAG: hypothetical protein ACT4QD_00910 [Acidobacteriota bacterium]